MQNKVQFGLGQITNATPKAATWVFRIILYVTLIVDVVILYFGDMIAPEMKALIAVWSVKVIGFTHAITRLFGIKVDNPRDTYEMPQYTQQQ
jgi:hypothetical protein